MKQSPTYMSLRAFCSAEGRGNLVSIASPPYVIASLNAFGVQAWQSPIYFYPSPFCHCEPECVSIQEWQSRSWEKIF